MSKWEKAKSVYVSISLVCMIIYLIIGAVAGIAYGLRYVTEKLRSRREAVELVSAEEDAEEYFNSVFDKDAG